MNKFGERIKSLRVEKELTTNLVGESVRIPQSRLSEIEKGIRIPTPGQIERLAVFFDVTTEELAALSN
jgi:transcriptional regulator with XRE-family HTH domain